MSRILPLFSFLALVLLATWVLVRWLTSKAKREYEASAKRLDELKTIPVREAMSRADALLERGELFRSVRSPAEPSSLPEALPPLLRAFFSRYESVETTSGQLTSVARADLRASEAKEGFVTIGKGMQATDVEFEIAIRPGREEIVELYSDEEADPKFGTYPTMFHWILAVAAEVQEARTQAARR